MAARALPRMRGEVVRPTCKKPSPVEGFSFYRSRRRSRRRSSSWAIHSLVRARLSRILLRFSYASSCHPSNRSRQASLRAVSTFSAKSAILASTRYSASVSLFLALYSSQYCFQHVQFELHVSPHIERVSPHIPYVFVLLQACVVPKNSYGFLEFH